MPGICSEPAELPCSEPRMRDYHLCRSNLGSMKAVDETPGDSGPSGVRAQVRRCSLGCLTVGWSRARVRRVGGARRLLARVTPTLVAISEQLSRRVRTEERWTPPSSSPRSTPCNATRRQFPHQFELGPTCSTSSPVAWARRPSHQGHDRGVLPGDGVAPKSRGSNSTRLSFSSTVFESCAALPRASRSASASTWATK